MRALLLCSRQAGKSQVADAMALCEAILKAPALELLFSQNQRASAELFRDKLLPIWRTLGCPYQVRPPTQLSLELLNGSRIVSLPSSEGGIRGSSGVRYAEKVNVGPFHMSVADLRFLSHSNEDPS